MKPGNHKCGHCGNHKCEGECKRKPHIPEENRNKHRPEKDDFPQRVWPTDQEKDKGRKI